MFRPGSPAVAGWSVAAGVVVIAPWLDGSPRWPAWFGWLTLALGLALGLGSRRPALWTRGLDRPTRLLVVFVALLLGLALLQTLPLGEALGWLSPAALEARRPFLLEGHAGPTCLSLEPHLTRIGAMAWTGAAVIAALAARAGEPRWLCGALLAGGALQAAVALSQVGVLARARGTFVSPNNLGALLALLLPVALALAGVGQRVAPRGWRRGVPLAAGGVLLLGLVASRSRSGALAAVVAVGLYLVLVDVARGRRAGWLAALALLILGVAGADLTLDRFDRLLAGEETDRLTLWAVGWQLFVRFPLLGAGLRSHSALTPELLAEPRLLDATHNDYLNLLADCGLVGGALALGAAVAWTSRVRRRLRELPAGGARHTLVAACAAAAAGMAVASVVEFGLQVAPILWTFAALAGIAADGDPHAPARAPARAGAPRAWTRALGWALGLAALSLAFHGARLALSRAALDGASDPRAPMTTRREGFARAARLWPEHGRIDVEWGRALLEHGDRAGAAQVLARACRKAPRDPWAHLTLARALVPTQARRERLAAARRLAPYDPAVRLEAGRQALALAASSGASPDDRALALADLRAAVLGRVAALPEAIDVLLAQPAPAVADFEGFLPETRPDLRRRCVDELAPHSPGPARLLLEPLLTPGGDAHDLARAASLDLQLGRLELAREEWLEAARTHPRPGDLLRGAARDLARRPDLAEALLKDAAAARPDEPEVWLELGRFLLAHRRPGEARVALERVVDLDPHAGWRELGDAHAAEGRRESARLAWKRALTAAVGPGERADLHLRVARSLASQGDTDAALDEARAALGCDPDHAGARALVDQLRRR